MEMKFDPKAKVKQGDLSTSPEGKQPNQAPGDLLISPSKEDVLANTGDEQGDLSTSPEGKQPNQAPGDLLISPSKEDVLANTGDGKFGYHEPKKFKSQLDANLFKMADERDY